MRQDKNSLIWLFQIPCSKSKKFNNKQECAEDAYCGTSFKYAKIICKKLNYKFLIFSAKYGLIEPQFKIEDYNISFKNKKDVCININEIKNQYNTLILNKYDNIITFCGNEYNKFLFEIATITINDFFKDLDNKSMGYRLNYLKNYCNNIKINNNINKLF